MITIAPLLFEAENYLVQRDLDRAAALYQRASALDPDSALPHVGLARIALALGRHADGLAMLESVLKQHPASVEALTMLGVAAEANGQFESAAVWLKRALSHDSTYGPAAYNLGRILAQQHRWPEACAHLQRASELLPNEPEVAVNYGIAAYRAGSVSDAVAVLRRCIETSPFSVLGYVTLADVLVEMGRLDLADALLKEAEARFSRQAIFPSKRAAVAMRRGDVEGALVHARKQVALAPALDEGWLLIAMLELTSLNVAAAEAAVHEVLRRNPTHWRAHYQLGGIYETLRLLDLAQHAYRNAVALAPNEWQPRNNLATLLLEHEDPASATEARELLEKALQSAPADEQFMTHYNLALACWKLGHRAQSEQHAREAARTAPVTHAVAEDAKRFLKNFETVRT